MIDKDIEILKELANVKFDKQLLKSISIIKPQDEVYLLNIQERQAIENVISELENYEGKIIHLSDEEYRRVIENAQKDIKSELETYKKIAEKLAEKLTYERGRKQDYMFCIDICEDNWCDNKNCNQCMENIIEWARKEVEK